MTEYGLLFVACMNIPSSDPRRAKLLIWDHGSHCVVLPFLPMVHRILSLFAMDCVTVDLSFSLASNAPHITVLYAFCSSSSILQCIAFEQCAIKMFRHRDRGIGRAACSRRAARRTPVSTSGLVREFCNSATGAAAGGGCSGGDDGMGSSRGGGGLRGDGLGGGGSDD